jgi:hypothetical protein
VSILTCSAGCTTTSCVTACGETYPVGVTLANAYVLCTQTSCSSQCQQ